MSQSNNSEELDNILFGHNTEEPRNLKSQEFEYTQNMVSMHLYIDTEKVDDNGELMSVDDFLDLIPANGFFH